MTEKRPSDSDIATYINDLENALADAKAPAITNSRLFETVHVWASALLHPEVMTDQVDTFPCDTKFCMAHIVCPRDLFRELAAAAGWLVVEYPHPPLQFCPDHSAAARKKYRSYEC